jgi:hypothetical protein
MTEPIDTPGYKAASAAMLGMALPPHYLERLRQFEAETHLQNVAESFGMVEVAAQKASEQLYELGRAMKSLPKIRISKHRQARQQRFRARHKS